MTRRTGFTFVEILVAMAVFSVLTAVAVPKYHSMRGKAFTAALKADLAELRIAEEGFWAENHFYTTDPTQLDWRATSDVRITITASGNLIAASGWGVVGTPVPPNNNGTPLDPSDDTPGDITYAPQPLPPQSFLLPPLVLEIQVPGPTSAAVLLPAVIGLRRRRR